jgi:hypothetical protein
MPRNTNCNDTFRIARRRSAHARGRGKSLDSCAVSPSHPAPRRRTGCPSAAKYTDVRERPTDRMSKCREVHGCTRAADGQDVRVPRSTRMYESGRRTGCPSAARYKEVREQPYRRACRNKKTRFQPGESRCRRFSRISKRPQAEIKSALRRRLVQAGRHCQRHVRAQAELCRSITSSSRSRRSFLAASHRLVCRSLR